MRAEEIAQWLRVLDGLGKNPSSVSTHTSGGSQPLVTPVPGDPIASSGLRRCWTHVVHI